MGVTSGQAELPSNIDVSSPESDFLTYDIEDTARRLESWEEEFEAGDNELEADTSYEMISCFLEATGDLNPLHVKQGLEEGEVSDHSFREFLDEIASKLEGEADRWTETREQRDLQDLYGAVLPGMSYLTLLGLDQEEQIQEISGNWVDVAWIGDSINIRDSDDGYQGFASTPEGTDPELKAELGVETCNREEKYSLEKTAVANKVVARHDRRGHMLVDLKVRFEDTDLDRLEWEELELERPTADNMQRITGTEKGDLWKYSTRIRVDGEDIGEATETFLDSDGYQEIESQYTDNWRFNPFNPMDYTLAAIRISNAAMGGRD